MHLLDILFPPREEELFLRNISVDDFLTNLAPNIVPVTRPGTITLLPFKEPVVRAAIHETKYHGSKDAFRLLASALAEYLRDSDTERTTSRIIVPIPLGIGRRRERGFNQVEAVVKRALSLVGHEGEHPFTLSPRLLERTRETVSQVSLPRQEREENMRGAFRATQATNPAHLYIIIDDVVTTGATLQAAIDALRAAGATQVIPLALAH